MALGADALALPPSREGREPTRASLKAFLKKVRSRRPLSHVGAVARGADVLLFCRQRAGGQSCSTDEGGDECPFENHELGYHCQKRITLMDSYQFTWDVGIWRAWMFSCESEKMEGKRQKGLDDGFGKFSR